MLAKTENGWQNDLHIAGGLQNGSAGAEREGTDMANSFMEKVSQAKLTKSQKKIADYFIQNQDKIGRLSAMEAAREIGVSDVSVIRFARALGFDGYLDLRRYMYDSLVSNSFGNLSLAERMAQSEEKFHGSDTLNEFITIAGQNLIYPFRQNHAEELELAADFLLKAKKKYIIGLRGNRGTAVNFGRLLSFMIPNVVAIDNAECTSISSMQDIGKGDVLIMFLFTRYYRIDRQYLELARKGGATVVLVTNDVTGDLSTYADLVLVVQTTSMTFFHSVIGVSALAEYLLFLIGRKTDARERLKERDELLAYQRE